MSLTDRLTLRQAMPEDLDAILALFDEAARWIATTGSDQWQSAWPTRDRKVERIAASIEAHETWMLCARDSIAGTFALDEYIDPALWAPAEQAEPAFYLHRFIIARAFGGEEIGASILDWCCDRAAKNDKTWVRIDVWATNRRLKLYYKKHQFSYLRTIRSEYPSGALFQRPAAIMNVKKFAVIESSVCFG